MLNLDFFNEETETPDAFKLSRSSIYQKIKRANQYKKATGEDKCKNCANCRRYHHNDKTYYKCLIIGISSSSATDIRVGFTCKKWEKQNEEN